MTKNLFQLLVVLVFCLMSLSEVFAIPLKKASLVVDTHTGKILHSSNAKELRYPASLVKMMTLYITFKEIKLGRLKLGKKLTVSAKAASQPRTNLSLRAGSKITVRSAILGVIVHSANDASVILAEAIAGSETKFAILMNKQAKKLGMKNTNFKNASGLPNKDQKTTAYDLAKLAIALNRNLPQFFHWFLIDKFSYNGKTYRSHNNVVNKYEWATGLKTGFTYASGFNLATTANKNGKHLVGIVLGGDTAKARDKYMVSLLNGCFHKASLKPTRKVKTKSKKKNHPPLVVRVKKANMK